MTDILTPDQVRLSLELLDVGPGAITFTVHGPASTKGSTRSFVSANTGRVVTLADAKSLPAWTQAVAFSAKAAGVKLHLAPQAIGIAVWLIFQRPQSVSVSKRPSMTVKPDVDKCLRATLDALTGIAYADDAQVVAAHVRKRYGGRAETIVQIWEENPCQ